MFGLKQKILILVIKSEWVIATNVTFASFSQDVLHIKVKNVLYKTIKTNCFIDKFFFDDICK